MADKPILYGFDASTYVRTVRMVLADKGIDYEQVPVNVLAGEPRQPEHLARHPFGKVPVLDIDGFRIRETDAICRYLEDIAPEPPLIPSTPRARARMNEAIGLIDSYGYGALVGVAGYHLFPDFIGGQNEAARQAALGNSEKVLRLLMENRDGAKWLAGDKPTLADYFLAPIMAYVAMTPDADTLLNLPGVRQWWDSMQAHETFAMTAPDLG